jgi:hypothetical protein
MNDGKRCGHVDGRVDRVALGLRANRGGRESPNECNRLLTTVMGREPPAAWFPHGSTALREKRRGETLSVNVGFSDAFQHLEGSQDDTQEYKNDPRGLG